MIVLLSLVMPDRKCHTYVCAPSSISRAGHTPKEPPWHPRARHTGIVAQGTDEQVSGPSASAWHPWQSGSGPGREGAGPAWPSGSCEGSLTPLRGVARQRARTGVRLKRVLGSWPRGGEGEAKESSPSEQNVQDPGPQLDRELLARRHVILPHAPGVRPVFMAFCIELTGWPDKGLPSRLLEGFPLAGQLEPSGVLLPIVPKCHGNGGPPDKGEGLLGQAAAEIVDSIEADRRPAKNSVDEVYEGTAGPLVDRQAIDDQFCQGDWRPLPRHVVWQGIKRRPIDGGEHSGTNSFTCMGERIACIAPEFAVVLARSLAFRLFRQCDEQTLWFLPIMSLEDLVEELSSALSRPCACRVGSSGCARPTRRPAAVQPVEGLAVWVGLYW